jgi:hypothetical protein
VLSWGNWRMCAPQTKWQLVAESKVKLYVVVATHWPHQTTADRSSASRDRDQPWFGKVVQLDTVQVQIQPTVHISQMSSPLSAQPLKVVISNGSSKGDQARTPVASRGSSPGPSKPLTNPADISSPHELTAFVRGIYAPILTSSHISLTEEFVSPVLFLFFPSGRNAARTA